MRRQRILRASSAQSLCIFCQCRLTGQLSAYPASASTSTSRRQLTTSQHPLQTANAAEAPAPTRNVQDPVQPAWTGFDPSSSLSATEQRERALLQQQREEQQRRVREAEAEQQRRRQEAARIAAQEREESRRAQEEQRRAIQQQWRKEHDRTKADDRWSINRTRGEQRQDPSPIRKISQVLDVERGRGNDGRLSQGQATRQGAQVGKQHGSEDRSSPRVVSHERIIRVAASQQADQPKPQPPQPPQRVAMPTFGAGPGKVAEPSAASSGGWGSGAAERPSLDSEEVLLREEHEVPENISQEQPQFATAPHAVVSDSPFDRPNGAPQVVNQATERRSQPPLQSRKNSWPQPDEQARSYERPEGPQGQTPQRSRQGRQIFGSSLNSGLGGTPPTPSQRHSNPTSAPLGGHDQSQWVRRYPLGTRSPPHEISESVTASGSNIGKARQSKPASTYGWNLRPDDESQQHESLNGQLSEIHQPVPPHRAEHAPPKRQTSYDDSGYQATILDPQDYQQPQAPFDDSHAVDWQHLRRRNSEPAPPAPQPQQQPRQDQQPWDDAAIDRIFLQHQQQRQQYQPGDYARPTPQQPAHAPMPLRPGERRCGRCGELGHVARECEGPIRSKCNVCGEAGHHARTCPRVTSNASGEPTIRRPFVSRDASAHRFVERTAARSGASWGAQLVERSTAHGDAASNAKNVESPTGSDFNRQHERMRDVQTVPKRDSAAAFVGERQADAVTDSQERTYSVPEPRKTKDEAVEDEEQPAERVFRSRKFADDAPRREKSVRRSRRDEDDDEDDESGAMREERNLRKAARKAEKAQMAAAKEAEKKAIKARKAEQGTPVNLPEFVSVATLAQLLGVRYESFVSRLERLGYDDLFPGKVLNSELSGMVAMEYNFEPIFESAADEAEDRDLKARPVVEDKEFLPTRPPVVTIMGHVDHGKTTILDYLRKSSVAAGEAGGITQHIGAFSVPLASSGRTITFLDTPGHAAFLAMRQRGANVTDIVILVVAADDSVKPQTLEAIKHAKAAGVPMIVAVNKVDKAEADVQRVKQDLARHGVEIEDFGGDTQVVCVSGKTGEGMDELEEAAVTLSEILDHRAETDGPVEGWVLEATTKKAGRVATVLVRRGTLKFGAVIVAGKSWARVRTLRNEAGVVVPEVGPGMPVEVDGWRDQPAAGDEVLQAPNEQKASDAVQFRQEKEEREKTATDMEAINESRRVEQEKREKEKMAARAARRGRAVDGMDYFEAAAQVEEEDVEEDTPTGRIEVPFIIKADVSGSAEAVAAYILGVSSPLIGPRILRSTVGGLNESDVELADTARGHIIAFNLPTDEGMKGEAEARGVKVLENNIIYRVLDDVKAVLEERLPPLVTHKVTGEAEISAAFEIGIGGRRTMNIAGCKVRNGTVTRGARVRVLRGDQKIFDGTIDSLKNVKKDVQEMRKGTECGMGFSDWEAFQVGDQVQTYDEISEKRKL